MTRLDGRPTLTPPDVGVWVRGLAQALAAVHRLDGAAIEGVYGRWHDPHAVQPPRWSRQQAAWARLIEASRDSEPMGEMVLLHRDYHPGNVLWEGGEVSGIVDWPNACRGVAGLDVGHCRRDIATTHGTKTAEAFPRRTGRPRDARRTHCATRSPCSTATPTRMARASSARTTLTGALTSRSTSCVHAWTSTRH